MSFLENLESFSRQLSTRYFKNEKKKINDEVTAKQKRRHPVYFNVRQTNEQIARIRARGSLNQWKLLLVSTCGFPSVSVSFYFNSKSQVKYL